MSVKIKAVWKRFVTFTLLVRLQAASLWIDAVYAVRTSRAVFFVRCRVMEAGSNIKFWWIAIRLVFKGLDAEKIDSIVCRYLSFELHLARKENKAAEKKNAQVKWNLIVEMSEMYGVSQHEARCFIERKLNQ
ncbi:MAG: hypothetical protein ACLP29_02065 [Dissulfurispiraceae bacterium]